MIKSIVLKDVKTSWLEFWVNIFNKYDILNQLEILYDNKIIYPNKENILEAFKYFEIDDTKLVILGQDPYINSKIIDNVNVPQAMGLSFSVPEGINIPPSLKNIFKELKNEIPDYKIPDNGNLLNWVINEKILLLNTSLTVEKGKSNSHKNLWINITNELIKYISEKNSNTIFLLMGNNAKSKSKLIDNNKHYIINSIHPSPLSAYNGFFNSNIFIQINNILEQNNKVKINW